jgi:outer membrane murein-binding lipoprotein Lpp
MRTTLALTAAAAVLLAGCASEAEQIAGDACDLFEEAFDGEPDLEAVMGLQEEMQELADRAEDAELSDEEMQTAMREECPDVVESLEGFSPEVEPD